MNEGRKLPLGPARSVAGAPTARVPTAKGVVHCGSLTRYAPAWACDGSPPLAHVCDDVRSFPTLMKRPGTGTRLPEGVT